MAAAAAMGDLFAPAYIHGNPESEAAVAKWQAENFAMTPEIIEASRGPSTTISNPKGGMYGMGGSTQTIPGSVDPEALRILAQGGKYDANARRNAIAAQVAAQPAPAAQAANSFGNFMGGAGYSGGGYGPGAGGAGGRITYVGGGVFLPEFDSSPQAPRGIGGYPWGQSGPSVSS